MDWGKLVLCGFILIFTVGLANAQATNTTNVTELLKQIDQLKKEIELLKNKNLKLEAENLRLKNQLSQLQAWDAHALMDALFMFTLTPQGKQYKLLFHEGGLGGIVVYQYVGYGLGDAGKYRQYKQIAFFKPEKTKSGYLKPGVVLRPVWGFNGSKEVRIRSISELINYEKKYNSIYGLIEYYKWMFNKYLEASRYAGAKILAVLVIGIVFGMFFGEKKHPIGRLLDYITIRRVTDFKINKEEKRRKKFSLFRR